MQITLNPADETPSTLRAVALMLSSIASDRDGGKPFDVNVYNNSGKELKLTVSDLPPIVGNEQPVAPGASTDSIPPPPSITGASENGDTTNGNELDTNGLTWDPRIHSGSKGKNQDGSWKSLRNVDKAIVPGIEAEIRAKLAGGAPAADAPPPPPPIVEQQQTPPPPPPPIVEQQQTPPPPPPLETQQQADAGLNPDLLKQQAFKRLSGLTAEQRSTALGKVGLATPADFLKEVKVKPELASQLIDEIVLLTGEE